MKVNSSEVAEKTQAYFIDVGKLNVSVSIITSVYNAENFLEETIKSVIEQTFKNFEYILVNDASTDNSLEIMQRYEKQDKRIRIIQLENNSGGPARPRNTGIENAKGEYIAFLDSDDIWSPEKLQIQIDTIENGNYDIVHTYANTIDIKSKIIGTFDNQRTYRFLKYFIKKSSIIYFSNYININSVLMRKDISIKFREDRPMVAIEDWMYWIENIIANKKVFLVEQYLIRYRINLNSISDRKSDTSLRKMFYMYAVLLVENKISYFQFAFAHLINFARIGLKKIKNVYSKE